MENTKDRRAAEHSYYLSTMEDRTTSDMTDYKMEDRTASNNVIGIVPSIGMRVEIRDPEFIWSSATVVNVMKVEKEQQIFIVTLRYDGWDAKWNETLPWHSPRVARLYTYTKEVKCLFDCFSSRKKSNIFWPCRVCFRMPHPNHHGAGGGTENAKESLRLENNIFIKPYIFSRGNIPKELSSLLKNGGIWISVSRLRKWRSTPQHDVSVDGYHDAWNLAFNDNEITGVLPKKVFEKGSLVNDIYCVQKIGGDIIDGKVRYHGFDLSLQYNMHSKEKHRPTQQKSLNGVKPEMLKREANPHYDLFKYEPPPFLREPIQISDPIYCGIRRISNGWCAFRNKNGNEVFLGSFPTQSQCYAAGEISKNHHHEITNEEEQSLDQTTPCEELVLEQQNHRSEVKAKLMDSKSVSVEACVAAYKKNNQKNLSDVASASACTDDDISNSNSNTNTINVNEDFSLHDYAMQMMRHQTYQEQMKIVPGEKRKDLSLKEERKSKRKRKAPRKVDLKNNCYYR